MNLIFFGTPEFAAHMLKAIFKSKHKILAVVTTPDKPAGRGKKIQESAVKIAASELDLKILQPSNLKDAVFLESINNLNPDIQVVVAFRMMPKVLWSIPPKGTFNLHASLLPQYRGAAPIQWAIIRGERKTGLTTFFIDEEIDTGKIAFQSEVEILGSDELPDLYNRLQLAGPELILKTLDGAESNSLELKVQSEDSIKTLKLAPKLTKENTKIDWHEPAHAIYNKIRGLNPITGAWSDLNLHGEIVQVKIFRVKIGENCQGNPGMIIILDKNKVQITTKDKWLYLEEMQFPTKKRMQIQEILSGNLLSEACFFM